MQQKLKVLSTHYKVLLETQKSTSDAIYSRTIHKKRILEILEEANGADEETKKRLRDELHNSSIDFYRTIKNRGVLQYHFVLKDNESFYRAHKPSKFGDDLTDVRTDFKQTNITKKIVRGFNQGRTAHAFRNTFPLITDAGKHVGAMEVSFSSDSFQWYLNTISGIHSHFVVDKHIFDTKTWKRDDLVLKYTQSSENENYMLTLGQFHNKKECIDENRFRLKSIREEIDTKILLGKDFSTYVKVKEESTVVSFLAIKNLDNKTVAWIVSYEESPLISSTVLNGIIIQIISFLLSLLIIYFVIKQILSKRELQEKHKLVNDILNSTDKIMFITDFYDVKFANNRFKDMVNVEHSEMFNDSHNHNLLSIFVEKEGFLSESLLKEGESFIKLISRTPIADRVVSLVDKSFEEKSFQITVSKSENQEDYLVTLSDITTMKKHYDETEKKAYVDGLTNVYNRNKFNECLKQELEVMKQNGATFSVAILDIDKFKDFNDTYGHLVGDEVLVTMAQTVNISIRDNDLFARWGGEEFVVLFRNISADKAKRVAQKLKDKIESNQHSIAGVITASFGITEYMEGDDVESLFKRCDEALYLAKENGRNRVEVL